MTFLERLMPAGFAGADVLEELAPDGWDRCGLVRAFHPTLEQWHTERLAMHKNLAWWRERGDARRRERGEEIPESREAPPNLEDSRATFEERVVDPEFECREIVGAVLWEIFSDNHSVIAGDGREVDLGSFRGTSSTLDIFDYNKGREFEKQAEDNPERDGLHAWDRGDHMRFYMGLAFISRRADYRPVYELVFRRLQALGADWIYRFPRLNVFRFERSEEESDNPADYSPSAAFAQEQEQRQEDEAFARMQEDLETANRESAQAAAKAGPPPIVDAYRRVYGRLPSGWPPG